ncbi:methylated-DNA--[protein]-cysteine S-methyltransferase [Sphingomonas sp.]|jgi:methylated-DNA-[protein]-cysteine S-methyltransferase|uniref:methylated-DNA--[protein]-cysteine S-methyltransferase n=1 Tax=Sphingomonas sp. TaxID=28214 RepID=UPI002E3549CD|nr:methylated-DNA--[protein]-cysteine S-methyltransferase [Sphingomonas sp.]HEX4694680.1 methylated-DNA--[protein]-cysteine S-methyltransferase [Sphingomonas sp.]
MHRYHVFETAHGFAAVGWSARGVNAFRLPAATPAEAERALLRRLPDAVRSDPPAEIAGLIAAAQRYFSGERIDFNATPIDLGEQSPFFTRVYAAVRALGWGESTTYGAVAKQLGAGPEFARDVGQAMAANPIPLIVPCHRVLAAGGKVGGFSAPGGSVAKARMLALEGVETSKAPTPPPQSPQQSFGF